MTAKRNMRPVLVLRMNTGSLSALAVVECNMPFAKPQRPCKG